MNKRVDVSGMAVNATVSSNLLISETTTEADFVGRPLVQNRTGMLEPVSTVDGKTFFYTLDAKADGDAREDVYTEYDEVATLANGGAGKANYDVAFNTAYGFGGTDTGDVAYGYIDYTFYLKAITTEKDQKLKMDVCNLLYNGAAITAEKAMRVAVLATDACADASTADAAPLNLKTILTLDSAENQDAGKAVSSTSALDTVTYNTDAVVCDDIDGAEDKGVTKYFKVVVRLYLEGEDKTCTNSTFANLDKSWALNVGFNIDASAVAVNKIASSVS